MFGAHHPWGRGSWCRGSLPCSGTKSATDLPPPERIARGLSLFNTALRTEYISLRGTFPSSAYYEYVRRLFTVYEYSVYE